MSTADELADSIFGSINAAEGSAIANIETSPDDAARAIELVQGTDVPAPAALVDIKSYETSQKRKLAQQIIRSNPAMQEWINANPIASSVANDDYGQLDIMSEATNRLAQGDILGSAFTGFRRFREVEKDIVKGFVDGYAWESQKQEVLKFLNHVDHPLWKAFVMQTALPIGAGAVGFDTMMRTFSGLFAGVASGAGSLARQITGNKVAGDILARDVYHGLQVFTAVPGMAGFGVKGRLNTGMPLAKDVLLATPEVVREAAAVTKTLMPWMEAGKTPPLGLHEMVDKAKAEQAKEDVDSLLEATKEAAKSGTRDRAPDLFADFVARQTNQQVAVSADAVRAIYGEKVPTPDDGKLGWVPGIADQLALSEAYGGDIVIPMSEWLARIEPDLAKELRDDIRVRAGEPTLKEIDLFKEEGTEVKAVDEASSVSARPRIRPHEPVEAVRAASGLEPMFALGDRKLSIQKREQFEQAPGTMSHEFTIADERGKEIGFAAITEHNNGKTLMMDNITIPGEPVAGDMGNYYGGVNRWGPAQIRDLITQIKEAFPNAESVVGFRISGAREKANAGLDQRLTQIKFSFADLDDLSKVRDFTEEFNGVMRIAPDDTVQNKLLQDTAMEVLDRIAPKKVAVDFAESMQTQRGRPVHGFYERFEDAYPVISLALDSGDVSGYARHEAIHHLRQYKFFTPEEWSVLRKAAIDEKWLSRFDIGEKYKDLSISAKLEEAIAEGYRDWASGKEVPKELHPIFQKMKELFDFIKEKLKAALGREPTFEDVFRKVESGEVGRREGGEPDGVSRSAAKGDEPELPGITRMEDREAFAKASAIGMTVDQYARYMKKIEERQAADFQKAMTKAEAEQKRRLSDQWKEWSAEERPQAVVDVNQRPYVAADKFFREGEVYGETFDPKPRINPEFLTPEQVAELPPSWFAKRGMNPDDIAPLFGYQSGGEMLAELGRFHQERVASKKRPEEYHRALIEQEVNRRVEAKHGRLEENILNEAIDQALSKTQVELLHEETLALASKAGLEFAIDPVAFEREIRTAFERQRLEGVSSERILNNAGKAGRAAELALLHDNPVEAFREKQRQYIAVIMAREARQLEKDKAAVEKLAKRFSKREVKGTDQAFTNYVQALLSQAEYAVRVSPDEIQKAITFEGYKSLDDFVTEHNSYGWEIAVSEGLLESGAKPLDQMTVAEFRDFKDAVESLAYVGREVNKIEVAGEKMERAEFAARVRENLEALPVRPIEGQGRWLYKIDASLTRMEEMIKDFDLRQELGPMFRAVIEPMVLSKTKKFDMLNDLVKTISKLEGFDRKWQKSLHDTIPQDFLIDPYYNVPFDLTRENLIQIMLNWGNRGNIEKLTRAYAGREGKAGTKAEGQVLEGKLKALIDQNATQQDWQYVQEIWKLFKGWQKDAEVVARNVSGVAPKWVEPTPIDTAFGSVEGGYYPIIYDKMRSNIGVIKDREAPQTGPMGKDYFRAATPTGHLKERTGYVDFVDITGSLEQVAGRMQQTIHDIAFRDAVIQTGKVFYDKEIRAAIRKHYGSEYEAQLVPWLRRVANEYTADEAAITGYNDFMRRARVNLIGHALPLNLKVIGSPDVGALNPKAVAEFEANRSANVKLAMEKSNEIRHLVYNMDRDFRERLEQTIASRGWSSYQAQAVRWGFVPMMKASQEFRMVTFVQKYNDGIGRGLSEHEAAVVADSYVRERHGAASVVDLPAVMTSNEAMKSLTMFYGFFNTMYNWQRQLPGNVRRGEVKDAATNLYGSVLVGAAFGALLFNQSKEGDSWWKIIAKALALQPLSTIPIVREGASFFFEGFPQRTPTESIFSAIGALKGDIARVIQGKPAKNPVKNTANVVGLATGLPLAQVGRTGEFLYDVNTGQQRPRNILEWIRGIVHGEARLKK